MSKERIKGIAHNVLVFFSILAWVFLTPIDIPWWANFLAGVAISIVVDLLLRFIFRFHARNR
jgi:hypothetical protein